MFDPSVYNDQNLTREIIMVYKEKAHKEPAYIHHKAPVLMTHCSKVARQWKDTQFPGWNADWMLNGLATNRPADCLAPDNTTLLIVQRHGFANFYHSSEDFFNAFLALHILGLRPVHVRLLLADLYPWGPFASFWKRLFPDARTAWEVRADPPRCYRRVVVGIFGPASPLTLHREATRCTRSPLVRAYASWVKGGFGVAAHPRPKQGAERRLLWLSRLVSALWPEQAYCDDRYFVCADWQHLGVRQLKRVLANDAAVVAALRAQPGLRVVAADFAALPFEQQVAEAAAADILAGPHGAGLTHLLFLPDWGCVVEAHIDGSGTNLHFANLAAWRGLAYGSVSVSNPAQPALVVARVWSACAALLPAGQGRQQSK